MDHFLTVFNTRLSLLIKWTNNVERTFATLTSARCVLSLMPRVKLATRWEITDGLDMKTWRTWHVVLSTVGMTVMYELRLFLVMSRRGWGLRLAAPGALPERLRGAAATLVYSVYVCKSVISSPPSRESTVVLQDLGSDNHEEDVGKRFGAAVRIGIRSWGDIWCPLPPEYSYLQVRGYWSLIQLN